MNQRLFLLLSVLAVGHAATEFDATRGLEIVCSDSMDNVCTAPTSCNSNGQVTLDSGNNLNVGQSGQLNGLWTVRGGYTIRFPDDCFVTCQGDCVCEGCASKQVADFDSSSPSGGGGGSGAFAQSSMVATAILLMAAFVLV